MLSSLNKKDRQKNCPITPYRKLENPRGPLTEFVPCFPCKCLSTCLLMMRTCLCNVQSSSTQYTITPNSAMLFSIVYKSTVSQIEAILENFICGFTFNSLNTFISSSLITSKLGIWMFSCTIQFINRMNALFLVIDQC